TSYFKDADGDGYGDSENSILACNNPGNYVLNNTDCNDSNAALNNGTCIAQYRTKNNGVWNDPSIWETSADGVIWLQAHTYPTYKDGSISIQHYVEYKNGSPVIDQATIE